MNMNYLRIQRVMTMSRNLDCPMIKDARTDVVFPQEEKAGRGT